MKRADLLIAGGVGVVLTDGMIGFLAFDELLNQGRPWIYGWMCVGLVGMLGLASFALGWSDLKRSRVSKSHSQR